MDDFNCDITVYQVPASYSDQEIEDGELWENTFIATAVGQVNSTYGDATRGEVTVRLRDSAHLEPGYRLFAKLRLPHVEWEGEEVDYVAASVPVLQPGEQQAPVKVLLYNLDADGTRGTHIRAILASLGVEAQTVTPDDLGQTIGHLAGLPGFEASEDDVDDEAPSIEFMVMCGFSESLLDAFLDAMQAEGIRVDHKAIVTEHNRSLTLLDLMGDIHGEHAVFQALLALDKVIKAAEDLDEQDYGTSELWAPFQEALAAANAVLSSYEPGLQALTEARETLIKAGNALTEGAFWADPDPAPGPEEPVAPVDPDVPTDPTEPVDPDTPADPTEPGAPADPEGPVDPADPADPTEPGAADGPQAGSTSNPAPGASTTVNGDGADVTRPADAQQGRPAAKSPTRAKGGSAGRGGSRGARIAAAADADEASGRPAAADARSDAAGARDAGAAAARTGDAASRSTAEEAVGEDAVPLAASGAEAASPLTLPALIAAALAVAGAILLIVTRRRKNEREA